MKNGEATNDTSARYPWPLNEMSLGNEYPLFV